MQYIVKSGAGHFVKFQNNTPEMTSDPDEAQQMSLKQAETVAKLLDRLGFSAELVQVRIGEINDGST